MNRRFTLLGGHSAVGAAVAAGFRAGRGAPKGRAAARAGAEVRGRPDVAQADGQSVDPRIDHRRGDRLARPHFRRPSDRQLYLADRDRIDRRRGRLRRVLRLRRRTCSSSIRRERWSRTGADRARATTGPRRTPARDRRRRQCLDRRRRRQRYENSQVLEGRQVHRAVSARLAALAPPAPAPARGAGDTAYAGVSPGRGARRSRRRSRRPRRTRRRARPRFRRTATAWTASAARWASRSTARRTKYSSPTDRAIIGSRWST